VQAGLDPCWSQTHYVGFVMSWLICLVESENVTKLWFFFTFAKLFPYCFFVVSFFSKRTVRFTLSSFSEDQAHVKLCLVWSILVLHRALNRQEELFTFHE
jgi:hypothetical protein